MPANCALANDGEYAPRHNPAVYYPGDAAACALDDVPAGTPTAGALATDLAAGSLPSYGLFIPNLCNDGHDSCNGVPRVAEEDATIAAWMPTILASPDYQSGHLLVVVTADTSQSPANGNLLATILVNPDIVSGTQAASRFDHYSLLRLDEDLLGLPPLANAAAATDMAAGFNLRCPSRTAPAGRVPRAPATRARSRPPATGGPPRARRAPGGRPRWPARAAPPPAAGTAIAGGRPRRRAR